MDNREHAHQTRAALLTQSTMGEAIFGQELSTIDWLKVINTGQIVLVNTNLRGRMTARLRQAIGVGIVTALVEAGKSRSDYFRPDAWCFCDEFQEYVSDEFERSLDLMRSYRVWFVLAHQHLAQIEETQALESSLITNCDAKVIFKISHADAERVVYDLFDDYIHGDHLKEEIKQTKFSPHTVWVDIYGEVSTTSWADADSQASTSGSALGTAIQFGPDGLFLPGPELGHSASDLSSASTSRGSSHASGGSFSESHVRVPITQYEMFQEVSSRTYYQVQEIVQRCCAWITQQHKRRAYFKLLDRKAMPIVTGFVGPVDEFSKLYLANCRERVYAKCARPYFEVIKEVRARRPALLKQYEEFKKAEEEAERAQRAAKDAEFQANLAATKAPKARAELPKPKPRWGPAPTIRPAKSKVNVTKPTDEHFDQGTASGVK